MLWHFFGPLPLKERRLTGLAWRLSRADALSPANVSTSVIGLLVMGSSGHVIYDGF